MQVNAFREQVVVMVEANLELRTYGGVSEVLSVQERGREWRLISRWGIPTPYTAYRGVEDISCSDLQMMC